MNTKLSILGVSLVVLVGCTVGPDYERPELEQEVPDAWKSAAAEEIEKDGITARDLVDDTQRSQARRADSGSPHRELVCADRRRASARGEGPFGDRHGAATTLTSLPMAAILECSPARTVPAIPLPDASDTFDLYNLGVGFNWEIDVFGRLRRGAESARAGLEASVEDYRDVMVILMADVAANYVEVRTLQDRIKYGKANVEAQAGSLQLTQDRFDAGLSPLTDVTQAEYNLANSQAAIPSLEARLAAATNRLAVLLGKPPGAVDDLLTGESAIPDPDEGVTLGIPADLLRRRPDIRAAERQLASQTALIGVAKADLYPTFSLAGILALESFDSQ